MIEKNLEQFFDAVLFQSLGESLPVTSYRVVTGGCINNALKISTERGPYFLKWNQDPTNHFFETEARGLELLRSTATLTVPEVYNIGEAEGQDYILMEYLEKQAPSHTFWEDFGIGLAELHKNKAPKYGLDHQNYIGSLPQKNEPMHDWVEFFIENRLEVQLGLAIYNNLIDSEFARRFRILYAQLPGLLVYEPPSLLHGDLWTGNFIIGPEGQAAIMDPAVYYGNREMEMAYTQLFGGFDNLFYTAYFDVLPVEPGFQERADIYNLYPLLVHVNLFGSSYLSGVERVIRRYC